MGGFGPRASFVSVTSIAASTGTLFSLMLPQVGWAQDATTPPAKTCPADAKVIKVLDYYSGKMKELMDAFFADFEAQNKDVCIQHESVEQEALKANLEGVLSAKKPDIYTWNGGFRLKVVATQNLTAPLSKNLPFWKNMGKGLTEAVTVDGKYFLAPFFQYHTALFYNKSVLAKAGITNVPTKWDDFLASLDKLKKAGVTPIALGAEEPWTAGYWFNYLVMNTLGSKSDAFFSGKVPYTSPEVRKVFERFADLVNQKHINENATKLSWKTAATDFRDGKAAYMLSGAFWIWKLELKWDESQYGAAAFPSLPVKGTIPKNGMVSFGGLAVNPASTQQELSEKLIAFLLSVENQERMSKEMSFLPVVDNAKPDSDKPFLKWGHDFLSKAKLLSQNIDIDTQPDLAEQVLSTLTSVMNTGKLDPQELERLEKTRKRVFRVK